VKTLLKLLPLVIVLLAGCATWRAAQSPQQAIARAGPNTVRVLKKDSSIVSIQNTTIVNDTLRGLSADRPHRSLAIPLNEIERTSTREVSLLRTAGAGYEALLGGLLAALVVISIGLAASR
jgi:hypothetical protein